MCGLATASEPRSTFLDPAGRTPCVRPSIPGLGTKIRMKGSSGADPSKGAQTCLTRCRSMLLHGQCRCNLGMSLQGSQMGCEMLGPACELGPGPEFRSSEQIWRSPVVEANSFLQACKHTPVAASSSPKEAGFPRILHTLLSNLWEKRFLEVFSQGLW